MVKKLDPIHPGEILLEEFMKPANISQNFLSREIKVPVGRINEIIQGKRGISPDTALRLHKFFGPSPEFWLHLQTRYDIKMVKRSSWDKIDKEIVPYQQAV